MQLFDIGASVKGDEVESKLKAARQEALRALRDKTDLFEGGDNVLKFGVHRFNVNTQPVELALVPRKDDGTGLDVLYTHLTGTDFFERIEDAALEEARDLWDQPLVSESAEVYRSEYLVASLVSAAERGEGDISLDTLTQAQLTGAGAAAGTVNDALLEIVRTYSQTRHDEGYERGVHDVDAALLLDKVLALRASAGLLRYGADARALASLGWASFSEVDRGILQRRAQSYGRLRDRLASVLPQVALAEEIEPLLDAVAKEYRFQVTTALKRVAARYLVDELAAERARFVQSSSATALKDALIGELESGAGRRDFDEDLRLLEKHPAERLGLAVSWFTALLARYPDLAAHKHALREAAVAVATEGRVDREPTTVAIEAQVLGLLGQHANVKDRSMTLRLDEWLGRLDRFQAEQAPRFRKFRKTKLAILDREKKRLRLDEFTPRILSSFVRNRLIDEVYLPLVGANLAKQMGSAGETKRTDQMGLLLLISPPGYGKTTLMEYVANKLGLIFMKVNGPALGHDVTSVDPNDAPNATARQEVDKINLALEMGNNVMLYLDDIQHTNPELLQKFISLCDAQRKIEGVWNGRTRTYDLRGKKFCVVMAGNPYTESGETFKIPDMLANRADTHNLGDVLSGKEQVFALSYLENAMTSNSALAPLAGRSAADLSKFLRLAGGDDEAGADIEHPYSAAEREEIVAVLKRLFKVQKTLLGVNRQYIESASQDDNYRTEPPFKLQGSYRNMNKLAEKVVSAMTDDELDRLVDDHYRGESQTLTSGAEQNLLKLAEIRGKMTEEQRTRWDEVKRGFKRIQIMGSSDADPVARVTAQLSTMASGLEGISAALTKPKQNGAPAPTAAVEPSLAKSLEGIAQSIRFAAAAKTDKTKPADDSVAKALETQLKMHEEVLQAIVRASRWEAEDMRAINVTLGKIAELLSNGPSPGS